MDSNTPAEAVEDYIEAVDPDDHTEGVVAVRVEGKVVVEDFPPRTITTDQIPVGIQAVKLAPSLRTRSSLTLTVRGSSAVHVYVGGHGSITTSSGFLVTPESSMNIEATGEVWAIADAPGSTVHLLAQHKDG